ncbi:hypothetical protein [Streptomyces sp. ISL-100]|uniref:hypothetical protein n=1 Tax=Streptomyces sp. ISL-100 TaxID=2819173 RepID=UPI001BE58A20|nr:hypothetical protein [Streptomyces sp. ISL-100]MBT2395326.1 hypothetical protein [Streptomyces sp. ISL-100]
MAVTFRIRRRAAVLAGSVLLATGLPFTLSACGSAEPPAGQPAVVSVQFSSSLTDALEAQVTAQDAEAKKAAERKAADSSTDSRKVCTTDPADRSACRNPSGKIDPNGGDLDGDGVFEPHEPVGPGYKDPRAYDGGKTSGETQCEWLRSQGIAC